MPPDPVVRQNVQGMAVLTSAMPGQEGGGAVPMRESVAEQNQSVVQSVREQQSGRSGGEQSAPTDGQQQQQTQQPTTYMVTVPQGIMPGMQFAVEVEGQRMSECTPQITFIVC